MNLLILFHHRHEGRYILQHHLSPEAVQRVPTHLPEQNSSVLLYVGHKRTSTTKNTKFLIFNFVIRFEITVK